MPSTSADSWPIHCWPMGKFPRRAKTFQPTVASAGEPAEFADNTRSTPSIAFIRDEKLFVGGRYDKISGEMFGVPDNVGANRLQFSGGDSRPFVVCTSAIRGAESRLLRISPLTGARQHYAGDCAAAPAGGVSASRPTACKSRL